MAKEEQEQKVQYRISGAEQIVLYLFAALFDLLTFIVEMMGLGLIALTAGVGAPIAVGLNMVVSIVGGALMAFFFWLNGVSVFSQKVAMRYWGRLAVKIIPLIGILPAFTYATWAVIDWSRKEDKHKLLKVAETAVAAKSFARSKSPATDASAMDRNVAAIAKKGARTADRIDGSSRTGDKLRAVGDEIKGLDAKGSITRRDLATSGLLGGTDRRQPSSNPPAAPAQAANDNDADDDVADAA